MSITTITSSPTDVLMWIAGLAHTLVRAGRHVSPVLAFIVILSARAPARAGGGTIWQVPTGAAGAAGVARCGPSVEDSRAAEQLRLRGRAVRDSLAAEYGTVDSPALNAALRSILSRLQAAAAYSGLQLSLTLLDTDDVNAFVLPGGFVLVNTGMTTRLAELAGSGAGRTARDTIFSAYMAAVLAHEIAHLTLGHTGALLRLATAPSPTRPRDDELRQLSYSRDCELEADRAGALFLLRAGWEVQHAMDLQRAFDLDERSSPAAAAIGNLTYFRTHPRSSEREAELEILRGQLKLHQHRFDDALLLIRHNVSVEHAVELLEPLVADFPHLLPARHALAAARHQQWLNTVPVQVQRVRADMVTIRAHFLPGIRGELAEAALAEAARNDYERVLAEREFPETLSQLALLDAYSNRAVQAVERARRAASLAPGDAGVQNNLGVVLYLSGEKAAARDVFARAFASDSTRLAALFNLGRTLADLADPAAVGVLNAYIAADPESDWSQLAASLLGNAGGPPGRRVDRRAGAPPAVAGLSLADPLTRVISTLGEPAEREEDQVLRYPARGLVIIASVERGVQAIVLTTRAAGEIEGVRAGDPLNAALRRLGKPDDSNENVLYWDRGTYFVSAEHENGSIAAIAIAVRQ
jgi:predicted Zn-dependent protease